MKVRKQAGKIGHYIKFIISFIVGLTGLFWGSDVFAQAGALDCDFGNGGIVTTAFSSSQEDSARAIAVYDGGTYDGRIVVAGNAESATNVADFAIVRYLSDGPLDTSFSGDGKVTIDFGKNFENALAVAIQSDNKIVVVGHSEDAGEYANLAIARLNPDGSLDTSFSGDGKDRRNLSSTGFSAFYGNGIAIDGSGNIWIAGSVDNNSQVVKYDASGNYQAMYTRDLGGNNETFADILVDANQKLVVVGSDGGQPNRRWTVLRLNSDGTNDSTFNGGAALYIQFTTDSDYAQAVALSGTQVVVGGKVGGADFGVARINADGTLDTTFSGDGKASVDVDGSTSDQPTGVIVQSDGKIIIGSYAGYKYGFARFNTDGSLDTSFDGDGKVIHTTGSVGGDYPYAMEMQPDGRVVSAGIAWTNWGDEGKDFGVIRIRTQSENMTYTSTTTTQNNTSIISPGDEGEIIGIEVNVCGDLNPYAVTQLDFNTTGTTDPGDIVSAKVYYTGTSNAFDTTAQFGTTVNNPNGSFSVSGSQTLQHGVNYFWLAYNVSASATIGNVLDAQCMQVTLSGGVGAQTPTVTNPAGSREIKTIIFSEDFGAPTCTLPTGWSNIDYDNDTFKWIMEDISGAEPSGRSGCGVASESWNENALTPDNWLITSAIDLTSYSAATASYYIAAVDDVYPTETVTMYLSTSGNTVADFLGSSGHQLDTYTTSSSTWVERKNISLNAYVGQTVYLAWRHHNSTDNWAVRLDDILVAGVPVVTNDPPATGTVTANKVTQANAGGTSYTFTVEYIDSDDGIDVSTIDTSDVSVNNGATLSGASESSGVDGSPKTATYTVTPPGGNWDDSDNGTYTISLAGGQVCDINDPPACAAANASLATFTVSMDTTAPGLTSFTRQTPLASPTNADSLVFRVTFSENVQNVDAGDFSVNGTTTATVTNVAVVTASTVYDVTISGGDLAGFNGEVGLDLAGGQNITDTAGNALPTGDPATDEIYTLDNTAPGLTSFTRQTPAASPTNADSLVFRVTFSENVQNVDAGDFSVNGTTTATVMNVAAVTVNTVYDITVSGGDLAGFTGVVGLDLAGGQNIIDTAGNALPAGDPATDETYTLDNTAPGLTSFARQTPTASPTNADSLVFRVTFSENVQNVDAGDFSVNGTTTATVTNVAVVTTNTVYDITVSGGDLADFDGVVGLDLAGGQNITDTVGNALPAGEPATDETYTVDNTAPTVTINQAGGQTDPTTTLPINFTVVFNESVTGFTETDVTLTGTAGATTATVTGSGTTYNVAVSGVSGGETVSAAIKVNAAQDAAGNISAASTSTDNQVTYLTAPTVTTPTSADVTAISATLGGTIATIGGANVTERGIYWSTTDGFTPPGQGTKVSESGDWGTTGAFALSVGSLPSGATVYFKAFATNSIGTGYSEQASCFTGAILVTPETLAISEPSGSKTFRITLTSQPVGGADVSIPITSSNPAVCTVSPNPAVIANATWNTGVVVTVTAVNDSFDNPGNQRACTVQTGDPSSADSTYHALTAADVADVAVTVADDDVVGVNVTPASLTVSEPAGTKTFTIRLTSQPMGGANVSIPISSSALAVCTVSPNPAVITNGAWNTGVTVTVTAVDDTLDNPGDQRTCTVRTGDPSSADAIYHALDAADVADVAVTVADDENMEISVREKSSGTDIPHQGAYNLGTVSTGNFMVLEFTITNTGTLNLLLTGTPDLVALSGPQASDFQVLQQPTSPVTPGGSTNFIILFTSGSDDTRSATVTIANNDNDESPYIFTLVANPRYLLWTK